MWFLGSVCEMYSLKKMTQKISKTYTLSFPKAAHSLEAQDQGVPFGYLYWSSSWWWQIASATAESGNGRVGPILLENAFSICMTRTGKKFGWSQSLCREFSKKKKQHPIWSNFASVAPFTICNPIYGLTITTLYYISQPRSQMKYSAAMHYVKVAMVKWK